MPASSSEGLPRMVVDRACMRRSSRSGGDVLQHGRGAPFVPLDGGELREPVPSPSRSSPSPPMREGRRRRTTTSVAGGTQRDGWTSADRRRPGRARRGATRGVEGGARGAFAVRGAGRRPAGDRWPGAAVGGVRGTYGARRTVGGGDTGRPRL